MTAMMHMCVICQLGMTRANPNFLCKMNFCMWVPAGRSYQHDIDALKGIGSNGQALIAHGRPSVRQNHGLPCNASQRRLDLRTSARQRPRRGISAIDVLTNGQAPGRQIKQP
jgi:hypothetical protein